MREKDIIENLQREIIIPDNPERKQERTYDTGGEEKRETGLGRSRCGSACSWYDGVCGGL